METIREQLSAQYRFLELEEFFWGDYEGMMAQLKDAIADNEKIILYHQENINFYHTEWNGVPWINTIQMAELKQLVSGCKNQICVLAHGVHDSFPFEYINHFDFWIQIKNINQDAETIDHTLPKKNDFLFLTRRHTELRMQVRSALQDGYLEKSLYTYYTPNSGSRHLPKEYEHPKFHDADYKENDPHYIPAIWKLYAKQYQSTKYSIVAETVESNNIHCLSEKIFKPIIAGHIFVTVAGAGYLSYLRSNGFKTFGDYIDESYDADEDDQMRVNKIVQLCKNLSKMDHKKLYEITEHITKHNRTLFFSDAHLQSLNTTIKERVLKHFRD